MLFTTGKGDKVWGVIGSFKSHTRMLSVAGLGLWSHSTGTCHVHSILLFTLIILHVHWIACDAAKQGMPSLPEHFLVPSGQTSNGNGN